MEIENAKFLKYLRAGVEKLGDYFMGYDWLTYKVNAHILASFIQQCSRYYPNLPSSTLFKSPLMSKAQPRESWISNANELYGIVFNIQDRQREGANDASMCHDALSSYYALIDNMPDTWPGHAPVVNEKVINIIDNNAFYQRSQSYE